MGDEFDPIIFRLPPNEKYYRYQKPFTIPDEDIELKLISDVLKQFFNKISKNSSNVKLFMKWKLLKSIDNCPEQELHMDTKVSNMSNHDTPYSILISINPDTKLVLADKTCIDIPLFGMIMFRGDYMHAGAAYHKLNYRLFATFSNSHFNDNRVHFQSSPTPSPSLSRLQSENESDSEDGTELHNAVSVSSYFICLNFFIIIHIYIYIIECICFMVVVQCF